MTGGQEDEAALYHPGNAVVKPLTVGLNPWEAHELGGYNDTTNEKCVTINRVELAIVSTFSTCPSSPCRPSSPCPVSAVNWLKTRKCVRGVIRTNRRRKEQ